jgi:type II secretory pathway component PulC
VISHPITAGTPASYGNLDWMVFTDKDATSSGGADSSLASRFSLAGTYFVYDEVMNNRARKAIIDDLERDTQHIVAEGDKIGDSVLVKGIYRERVVLRRGNIEGQIWLSFSSRPGGASGEAEQGGDGEQQAAGKFGLRKVSENRRVMDRSALMAYYQELRDRPERLVQVFDSFDPLYDESGAITGYEIGIEGEEELFQAAGLKNGDIVRKVNAVPMSSRRRAEHFIRQFARDRANTFVLEIERGSSEEKMIYRVR